MIKEINKAKKVIKKIISFVFLMTMLTSLLIAIGFTCSIGMYLYEGLKNLL